MKMGLGAKLSTGMSLTPQMQQAIRLLQLSSLELEQEVQQKLDSNPLLERDDGDDWETSDLPETTADKPGDGDISAHDNSDWQDNWQRHQKSESATDEASDNWQEQAYSSDGIYGADGIDSSEHFTHDSFEMMIDTQWDDVYTHEPTGLSRLDTSEFDDDYKFSTQGNIQDHVRWQLNFKHLSKLDLMVAEYLIDSMDERGFIQLDSGELYHSLDTMLAFYQIDEVELSLEDIEVVVKHIQSCEPLGVGARNLAECLLIQLKSLPLDTPYLEKAKKLLAHHDDFVSNNITRLLKVTGLGIDDIQPSLALIRTLDPNPALNYQRSQSQYQFIAESYDIPDVLVSQTAQGWQVQLNPDTLPKLRVNQEYARLVQRNDQSEQGVYLKEQLQDARLFIRSIEERNQNLLKVATCIVKRQQAFFEQGVTAMQPMILRDVADEVELHESTVSRITTSKTMLTPRGLFSLKYFFSSQVTNDDGGGVSSTAISAMIKQMIDVEDPKKPLSDNAIMDKLKENGIDIARRTVTKYREAMNIAASTQRKQRF